MKIVIPARKGSKGLPFKNRILFKHTADIIPDDLKQYVYVLSDDKEIINMGRSYGFNITNRPSSISQDETSTSEVMNYFVTETKSDHTDDIYSSFAATTLGVSVIEKHFIISKK